MKLEVGKYYKSRDGHKWKCIHEYEKVGDYSYVCVERGEDYCESFTDDGRFLSCGTQHKRDLISEWVEPVEHEVDVWFYKDEDKIYAWVNHKPRFSTIAKVKVRFTEGQGL